jgi:hypothetical protein
MYFSTVRIFYVLQPGAYFLNRFDTKILFSNQFFLNYNLYFGTAMNLIAGVWMLWMFTVELTDWGVAVPSWAVKDQVRTTI